MPDRTSHRLRYAALTGVLTPGLLLGTMGLLGPADVLAQATSTNGACTAFGAPSDASKELSVADIATQVEPAIVTIVTPQQSGQGIGDAQSPQGDENIPPGVGSGFIVDQDGHVVTNAHVVAGAQDLTVTLSDGSEVPATVVGKDDLLDVALLKLDLPAGTSVPSVVAFGDSFAASAGRFRRGHRDGPRHVPQHGQ